MVNAKGIALIQVLLLTAVLALLALQFTLSAKDQVGMAQQSADKIAAELALRTAESEVLFSLLTQPKTVFNRRFTEPDRVSQNWNFHGQPFQYDAPNVDITIQDTNGQLSLYTQSNNQQIETLLRDFGINKVEAEKIVERLNLWRGFNAFGVSNTYQPRGDFVLSQSELKLIDGISERVYEQLAPLLSPYPSTVFNPITAPEPLLALWIDDSAILDEVLKQRQAGTLDRFKFTSLTGINEGEEGVNFTPSRRLQLSISAHVGQSVATKRMICYIRPENNNPVVWFQ